MTPARCGVTWSGRRKKSRKLPLIPQCDVTVAKCHSKSSGRVVAHGHSWAVPLGYCVFSAVGTPANQLALCRSLQAKAARKHPKEYRKARERYPSPEY